MKKYFLASLCRNGILGGGIAADTESITYHTGKLTIPEKYRHIEMKYKDIRFLRPGRFLLFPTVTLAMENGEEYKFLIFAKNQFVNMLKQMGVREQIP